MNIKQLILVLTLSHIGVSARSQHHFIRTDVLGYFYPFIEPDKDLKSIWGPKVSLAYEKSHDSSSFTWGIQVNAGYTPTMTEVSTVSPGSKITDVTTFRGLFIQPEVRYYLRGKRKTRDNMATRLFFEGYGMLFTGRARTHQIYYLPQESGKRPLSNDPALMFGLGTGVGYKHVFLKHFSVEPFVGFGYGITRVKKSTGISTLFTELHFLRAEASLGYCF